MEKVNPRAIFFQVEERTVQLHNEENNPFGETDILGGGKEVEGVVSSVGRREEAGAPGKGSHPRGPVACWQSWGGTQAPGLA